MSKLSKSNSSTSMMMDKMFRYFGLACTFFVLLILAFFLIKLLSEGASRIDWTFLSSFPSRSPEKAGIIVPLVGSFYILALTLVIAIPLGVFSGVYLEEYGRKSKLNALIEINIANLAGVPSIIYGLLALEIFVRWLGLGKSLLAGALTLSLLILPVIIVATREALKAVPKTIREASYALGGTKWQTILHQVLPAASGGILTGVILAMSRAIGESAPLIVIGAMLYISSLPSTPLDDFSVLPIQIFNWLSRPQPGFIINASAAIIILLVIILILNGLAIYLRNRWQKKVNW